MMLVKTYLAESSIEGLGVFAAEDILPGRTIWKFEPLFDKLIPKYSLSDAPGPLREYLERYGYDYNNDESMIALDADDAIYMNHSDAPNCDISHQHFQGEANRRIRKGEEITCDYRTFMLTEVSMQASRNKVGAQRREI